VAGQGGARAVGTRELGEAVLTAAGEREAVVVRDHGPVGFGPDLDGALARAFAVEENARIYALALLLGVGDRTADDERGL
jgi:L-fuculose-phosphate aldolase